MTTPVSQELIAAHHQDLLNEAEAYRRNRPVTAARRFGLPRSLGRLSR